jgi:hypothetical protein
MLGLVTYAFANTVTFSASVPRAGDGSTAVSGFDVTGITFNLNADPSIVDSVTLVVDSDPTGSSTMQIELVASSGTWYTCSNVTTTLTCDNGSTLGATVASIDQIRLLIAP